jgi:glycosyltransferase involved in cell wall biosynthesis
LTITVLTLGSATGAELWTQIPAVTDIVTFENARPDGRRAGSRALGLGLDSFLVAARAVVRRRPSVYVVTNPWIAVAMRAFTRRPFVVTGIYAVAHSRQWKVLRRVLGNSLMIVWSEVETEPWNAAGGQAVAVKYGNTFEYPQPKPRLPGAPLRVFVGGSSDRDRVLISALTAEVLAFDEPVRLDVAIGGSPDTVRSGTNEVITHGPLSQAQFGALMGAADVVYLPLRDNPRAAGHMIMTGALQLGVPVVTTPSRGMREYVDGNYVSQVDTAQALPALLRAAADHPDRREVQQYWQSNYSREALLHRVSALVESYT